MVVSLTEPERLLLIKLVGDVQATVSNSSQTHSVLTRQALKELRAKLEKEEKK